MNGADNIQVGPYVQTIDELEAAQALESLNPNRPPEITFLQHNLSLLGTEPLMKNCSQSDVDPGQGRFLIPRDHVVKYILPYLFSNEDPSEGILIRVYDKNGTHYRLLFQERNDGKYVITHGETARWIDLCDSSRLKRGDRVKLWTLRHSETNRLCFLIAKLNIE